MQQTCITLEIKIIVGFRHQARSQMAEGLLQSSYEREQVESVWEERRKDGAIARGTSNHHANVKDDA